MSQRIWKFRWQATALVLTAIACGYWAAAACAPPGPQSSCEPLPNGTADSDGVEIKLNTTSGQGRQVAYTRRIIFNPQDGSIQVETEVTADGQMVMSILSSGDAMGAQVQVEYGPLAPGAALANAFVENGMVTGVVDGRDLTPMPLEGLNAANAGFDDGAPSPDLGVDADLRQAVTSLFEAAENAGDSCQANNGNAQKGIRRQIPTQDTGHDSDPESSVGCGSCWASCIGNGIGCISGASAGCGALWICPPCLVACEVAVVAACAGITVGSFAACNTPPGPCCPLACGDVACCAQGESCLNPDIGLCCGEHKRTCLDEACCENDQTCIDFGPNAGTCCPPDDVCGNTCCDPTDDCNPVESLCCPEGTTLCDDKCCPEGEDCIDDGVCCPPENTCGTSCCDDLSNCIESQSICCGFDQPPCNGMCCDVGEDCHNNSCCREELICGNACCPEGTHCEANACMPCPNPTDHACPEGGCCPAGMSCTGDELQPCCPAGELPCAPDFDMDGKPDCVPFGECLQ